MNAATEVLRPDDEGVGATKKVGRWGGYNLVQGSIWGPDEILSIEGKQKVGNEWHDCPRVWSGSRRIRGAVKRKRVLG